MFIYIYAVILFKYIYAAENNSVCITPNGEYGKCIIIDSCNIIKSAIQYFDSEARKFAKQSQCGYINGKVFVCCGSAGKYTTITPPDATHAYLPKAKSDPSYVDNLLLPDGTLCGLQIPENKNSGTNKAEIDEFPWTAALKYNDKDGNDADFRCLGTLINEKYVVTLADCVHMSDYDLVSVRLGEWDFANIEDCVEDDEEICTKYIDFKIENMVVHNFYNYSSGSNNIALIRLKKHAKYSDFIRALCLPPSNYFTPSTPIEMWTSGWDMQKNGLYDVKKRSSVYIAPNEQCTRHKPKDKQHACVQHEPNLKDCVGNVGGPIMRKYFKSDPTDQEQFFLEGIITKATSCQEPFIYLKLSRYTNWIINNLVQ